MYYEGLTVYQSIFFSQLTFSTLIPIEYFSGQPVVDLARVSPDGKQIAAIYNTDVGPHLTITDFGKREYKKLLRLSEPEHEVGRLTWYSDHELIISIQHSVIVRGKARAFPSRLYYIDIENMQLKALAQKKNYRRGVGRISFRSYFLLSIMENDKDHLMVQNYDPMDGGQSVFKINIRTNKQTDQAIY